MKNSFAKQSTLIKILESIVELGNKCHKNTKDTHSLSVFKYKLQTVDRVSRDIESVCDKTNELLSQDDLDYEPDYSPLEKCLELVSKIKNYESVLFPKPGPYSTQPSEAVNKTAPKIKLPALELPSFDGNIHKFHVFYFAFKSMIHENKELSDDQRIQYLLGKLSDKALTVVSGIPPIGQNYKVIWDKLVDKFLDSRLLTSTYLDQLLSLKPIKPDYQQLNSYVDSFSSAVECLKALQIENIGEVLLCHIGASNLDPELRKQFELSVKTESAPPVDKLLDFLKEQVKILSRIQQVDITTKVPTGSSSPRAQFTSSQGRSQRNVTHAFISNEKPACSLCHKPNKHPIYRCEKFLSMSVSNRRDYVKKQNLCFSCLSSSHRIDSCTSKSLCVKCKGKHNSLLHHPDYVMSNYQGKLPTHSGSGHSESSSSTRVPNPDPDSCGLVKSMCSTNKENTSVLLSTVKVETLDAKGNVNYLRLLLDSGSESNFLEENTAKKLGLKLAKVSSSVQGICGSSNPVKGQTDFSFNSRFDKNIKFSVKALVVSNISDGLPTQPVNNENLSHLRNLVLSDDEYNVSKPVDGILGASIFSILLEPGKVTGPVDSPVAINTLLGYTVMGGKSHGRNTEQSYFCSLLRDTGNESLESAVKKFMELESVEKSTVTVDMECEAIFMSSYKRDETGRFTVSLPFKEHPSVLGNSCLVAKKRFLTTERKLLKSEGNLHPMYCDVMQEFLDKGFMSPIENDVPTEGYYIPTQVVHKQDTAGSFKLRPVFDASSASSSGKSLNDILYTGPNLYNDLFSILLSFRLFPVALTADIKKMYLQILLEEEHRKYQKILFRSNPEEELKTYTLNTVTFGLSPSPYLAMRCLHELATQEGTKYPKASQVVRQNSFMDDICCSVPSESEAIELQSQLVNMLQAGGFQLSKWASNSSSLLSKIEDEDKLESCLKWDDTSLKVLGLAWYPVQDAFAFQVNVKEEVCTKRNVLSLTASIFDVLGLVAPVVLYAKLLIKFLWQLNIGWDAAPPEHIQMLWKQFQTELPLLAQLSFQRHTNMDLNSKLILVGFSDSSEKGYGCAIYARVTSPRGTIRVNLLCARSKVCPLRTVSLARLELCSSLLLAKLMRVVLDNFSQKVEITEYYCLSDSKVTIDWIRSPAYKWKTFIANRVAKIHDSVEAKSFYHIPGIENVSDCITRGMTPSQLLNYPTWIKGPNWLTKPVSDWPLDKGTTSIPEDVDKEERTQVFVLIEPEPNVLLELAQRHSSWLKLLRSTVFLLRFLKLLPRRSSLAVLHSDLLESEKRLVQAVQQECFWKEINNIKEKKECTPCIQKLSPFLHSNLLRVGGRLSKSFSLGFEQKHPVLLPAKHHVTTLLVDHCHRQNLHTGPHLLLSLLRQKYWILGGRNIVRQRVRKCNHCFKFKPEATHPMMGELPSARVSTESKPFVHTGTDYTGSINITLGKKRGVVSQKCYVVLFICMISKCVHCEIAVSLSTESFMNAFKRFLARRGAVSVVYSDGATNYLGAKNKLDEVYNLVESQEYKDSLAGELAKRHIQWSFLPPVSPHMGGLWEGNIRMVKSLLLKTIGTQILTYEELLTVLTQVESLLNSRPLGPLSSDPNDVQVLTPAHFLHSTPLEYIPAEYVLDSNVNRLDRYKLLDHMVQSYWRRLTQEYFHTLQARAKWNTPQVPVQVGQVVIVKDDLSPPLMWNIGIITAIYPGSDGVIRVVQVRTKTGSYKRPVVKVCPLPTQ